jgi:hypothetical protein
MSTAESQPSRWHQAFRAITTGNSLIAVLSVVLALIAGSILIAVTDDGVQAAAGYFFARPGDTSSRSGKRHRARTWRSSRARSTTPTPTRSPPESDL